eukprot:Skav215969  [mRNA]  locus=scaffold498:158600:166867:- [translate_table: standard]
MESDSKGSDEFPTHWEQRFETLLRDNNSQLLKQIEVVLAGYSLRPSVVEPVDDLNDTIPMELWSEQEKTTPMDGSDEGKSVNSHVSNNLETERLSVTSLDSGDDKLYQEKLMKEQKKAFMGLPEFGGLWDAMGQEPDVIIVLTSILNLVSEIAMDQLASDADALMSGNVRIIRILRVTRVIRVVRVVKIVRFIRALRSLVHSIFGTLKADSKGRALVELPNDSLVDQFQEGHRVCVQVLSLNTTRVT